jgi:hypothetical protein
LIDKPSRESLADGSVELQGDDGASASGTLAELATLDGDRGDSIGRVGLQLVPQPFMGLPGGR